MNKRYTIIPTTVLLLLLLAFALPVVAAPAVPPPTVDGLLPGDEGYSVLGTNANGSTIYGYRDGADFYLALQTDPSVNDNVFSGDRTYTQSAGWTPPHQFSKLTRSDHAEWTITCADNSTIVIFQDYVKGGVSDIEPDDQKGDWTSPVDTANTSAADAARVVATASSLQWSMNNYTVAAGSGWDITPTGSLRWNDWKSPYFSSNPDQVPASYFNFDSDFNWEWKMIYEIKIDTSGTACETPGSATTDVVTHNSPAKNGAESQTVTAITLSNIEATSATGIKTTDIFFLIAMILVASVAAGLLWRLQMQSRER